ncbi:hypothetical protein EJ06DRAFT_518673 [Trichodelitschia bisporula]|uniref:Uncharacterized protein n=1 Tax=Trichodelitschia bisporula TaxID=703511 RepID=A0A6G1I7G9_9PEZI|nr:hypothetical protein EJ06DRAFT_518673 [Trichodelitschia bisporula]
MGLEKRQPGSLGTKHGAAEAAASSVSDTTTSTAKPRVSLSMLGHDIPTYAGSTSFATPIPHELRHSALAGVQEQAGTPSCPGDDAQPTQPAKSSSKAMDRFDAIRSTARAYETGHLKAIGASSASETGRPTERLADGHARLQATKAIIFSGHSYWYSQICIKTWPNA